MTAMNEDDLLVSLEVPKAHAIVLNEIFTRYEKTGEFTLADEAESRALDALLGAFEARMSAEWQEPGYEDRVREAYEALRED
jgi:hypothetical protein